MSQAGRECVSAVELVVFFVVVAFVEIGLKPYMVAWLFRRSGSLLDAPYIPIMLRYQTLHHSLCHLCCNFIYCLVDVFIFLYLFFLLVVCGNSLFCYLLFDLRSRHCFRLHRSVCVGFLLPLLWFLLQCAHCTTHQPVLGGWQGESVWACKRC